MTYKTQMTSFWTSFQCTSQHAACCAARNGPLQHINVSLVILWSCRDDEEKNMHKATRASKYNRGVLFPSIDLDPVPKCWKRINSPTTLEFFGDTLMWKIWERWRFWLRKILTDALLFQTDRQDVEGAVKASCESACVSEKNTDYFSGGE